MGLKINGEEREVPENITVSELLEFFNIQPGRVAVEVNLNIVKKRDYDKHLLKEGDVVEIVNFVGGG
ncbi:MAG: sulfur carrier protein ThiS [Nitrospirae bacterium]|nr:MAG: sulfur carrier protein ThiS [Nitrospirota bacterium]